MGERLTKSDVEKIQAEIDHRKLVERKELMFSFTYQTMTP